MTKQAKRWFARLVSGSLFAVVVLLVIREAQSVRQGGRFWSDGSLPSLSRAVAAEPSSDGPSDSVTDHSVANGSDEKPARGSDWPKLFGPTEDGVCTETNLALDWPKSGPPKLWEMKLGNGYSAPSIVEDRLIVFHRVKDEEVVERLSAETGERVWRFSYPTEYVDRYGYNNGPRCTPILDAGRVYTFGAEGKLHCLDLETGTKHWMRDLNGDYQVEQGFFGVGATPLLENDRLVINVGGKTTNAGIVAVDAKSGKTLWTATDQGASYATPRAATIHGLRHVFVFTEAGLVSVDPINGNVRWSIPFRSKLYESVNATSPVLAGDLVFVSATYGTGCLCLEIDKEGNFKELWRDRKTLDSHFSNILELDGHLYGFAGRHESGAMFRCVHLRTGEMKWEWETVLGRGSSVRVGDRLLLWGERGHLVSIDASTAKPRLRSFTEQGLLGAPCWTPPVISRGRLYLRNENQLLCLDLRGPAANP